MLGPGSVDLWLRSSARDVDLEVTLSEVRPDGKETYVQSGWLRASQRALDPAVSTVLEPVQTHTQADVALLPAGKFSLVRIPIFPFGHAFRAGSRIRISVQAPGGNRPLWAFDALPAHGRVTNDIAHSSVQPSRIVLPVVNGVSVPTPLPACPALRGQPCRTYVASIPKTK
jgi:predicted acyl esterase